MKDKLFRFAKRLLGQHEEAEDVVQDVFIRLWNRREKLDDYRSVEALAMVTAKNICLDKIRSRKSKPDCVEEYSFFSAQFPEEIQADYSDQILKVNIAIRKLTRLQQMVIHLRDVEEYEFESIASIVGMNENAVRVTLSRARKKVRELINNNKDENSGN